MRRVSPDYRTIEIFVVTLFLYYCFSQLIRFSLGILEERSKRHLARAGAGT